MDKTQIVAFAAVISAGVSGIILLISKYIERVNQLLTKRTEILLNYRLDAFSNYIKEASEFVYSSAEDGEYYLKYLKAYYTAKLVASQEAIIALENVSRIVSELRSESDRRKKSSIMIEKWSPAFELAREALRKDIEKLMSIK